VRNDAATFLILKNSRYEINNIYNQNAASVIHYHAAQCSGFASAFKVAMDYRGVRCIVVSGSVSTEAQSGPHAWNIVKLKEAYCTEMKTYSSAPLNNSVNYTQSAKRENTPSVNSNLTTFTRLFDVQAKIRECLKNRTTYYEFALDISMYSDEKLVRTEDFI